MYSSGFLNTNEPVEGEVCMQMGTTKGEMVGVDSDAACTPGASSLTSVAKR